jgi:hypothetical protein
MATNQVMREAIYEGILYIFLRAGEAMDVCDVVTLDASAEGFCKLCASGDVPFGFVAEKVTSNGVADYEPGGMVSHTAAVGDLVGVYICGGVYNHKASGVGFGDLLYIGGTDGKVADAGGDYVVGICVEKTNGDGICKVKSAL